MTCKQIAPGFSASGQFTPDDVRDAAARGFKSIICNRPDGEEVGQLPAELVAKQAEALRAEIRPYPCAADGEAMQISAVPSHPP